jgi:hypothetical protein
MKSIVSIKSINGKTVTIFTQSLSYIEATDKGCIVHINSGENIPIETKLKIEEFLKLIELDS